MKQGGDFLKPIFLECIMDELSVFCNLTEERYIYQEMTVYDILNNASSFFKRLMNDLLTFGKKVKSDVQSFIDKQAVRSKLKKLKKELELQKTDVKMVDVDEYIDVYKSYEGKILKRLNFLAKGNFKHRDRMISYADKLEKDIDEMNNELERIMSNKVKISIRDAIKYVEDNLSGKSNIEAVYVDACHKLNDMRIEVEHSLKDQALRTDDSFTNEYVGRVKRITTKASKQIGKSYSKAVFTLVAIFA